MNLKLALLKHGYARCNCCERIHSTDVGKGCQRCGCHYCDLHDADIDDGLCPTCERESAEEWRDYRQSRQHAYKQAKGII